MKEKAFFNSTSLLVILSLFLSNTVFAMGNSIVAVDKDGITGQYTSLVIDANGYPTASYYDATEGKLKVVHCFEKNCALLNTIVTPDAANNVGKYTAIALDSNGNPVVSYYDTGNSALKVLHCGNATCSSGNTIATVDSAGTVGQYTSITVDNNNFPVVSYYDVSNGKLTLVHCGNAACNAGNVIVKPDMATSNGVQSSIKLSASGKPIVAYYDFTQSALKILICGNANCSSANTIKTVDSTGNVGGYPSLVLDASGKPAVSYLDLTNGKLKILRCGDTSCSAGNTIASAGIADSVVGYFSSIAIDSNNFPVVSYWDKTNTNLHLLHCKNASCSTGSTISVTDATGDVGQFTSLQLDANGYPVISYYDATNGDFKVIHCTSTTCNPNSVTIVDPAPDVGKYSSLKLDSNGNPVVSYWDSTNGDLKVLRCGNANCTAGNTKTSPDVTGNTGWDSSLTLDANSNPVISLFDFSAKIMKVLHCNNNTCAGAGNTIAKPDILSRRLTSIALDNAGNPVVASAGQPDQGLRIVHCGDALCSANNTITSPDFPAYPFNADVRGVSMILDANGNPVVSFFRADKNQLKVLHCADAACSGPGNTVAIVDSGAQAADHRATSITLDAAGNPVVAYQDTANHALKVLHCGNATCTSGNTISAAETGGSVGIQPSIKLDDNGYPVVSYGTSSGMTVLHCGNAVCTSNNTVAIVDPGVTGWDSSLALDANGNPVISYYNHLAKNLTLVHCGTKTCL